MPYVAAPNGGGDPPGMLCSTLDLCLAFTVVGSQTAGVFPNIHSQWVEHQGAVAPPAPAPAKFRSPTEALVQPFVVVVVGVVAFPLVVPVSGGQGGEALAHRSLPSTGPTLHAGGLSANGTDSE
ncbi:hypothetical protein BKA70DRAFT_1430529 [Coprinopsis sp. MPI-PUGE-AT-0042]|nr:hypothetical protein BKA70DRAFT_1430529 [Coprinopsis sp. MPI-PUGE-AT-0042]